MTTRGTVQYSFSADAELLYVPLCGRLVALDRATGTLTWEMATRSIISDPPAVNGTLVVAAEDSTVYGIGGSEYLVLQ